MPRKPKVPEPFARNRNIQAAKDRLKAEWAAKQDLIGDLHLSDGRIIATSLLGRRSLLKGDDGQPLAVPGIVSPDFELIREKLGRPMSKGSKDNIEFLVVSAVVRTKHRRRRWVAAHKKGTARSNDDWKDLIIALADIFERAKAGRKASINLWPGAKPGKFYDFVLAVFLGVSASIRPTETALPDLVKTALERRRKLKAPKPALWP